MDYQVLARKWRPHRFDEMVGQEHILRILENALAQKRIHHAYLFTGTRGVGKTTIARILAKCLNCETGITSQPCGTCHTCQAITSGQFLDLYEVDAASRTKVEDTRELLENVYYPPTQGRFKVYLIDEVHMLSNHSFNALLKTLEEPPAHVKFMLATTDPKRLPVTILSRCLQFHLKRIPIERITTQLRHICDQEKIKYETQALSSLAQAADGSMRDALSLLDQAIAYSQDNLTAQAIHQMLGCVAREDLYPLLSALAQQNGQALFAAFTQLADRAPDFKQLLDELIGILHQTAIHQLVPQTQSVDAPIAQFSQQFQPEEIQLYYQIALLGRRDLTLSPSPAQGFEMILLRMLAFQPEYASQVKSQPVSRQPVTEKASPPSAAQPTPTTPVVTSEPINMSVQWREILPKLELTGMAYALAANCILENLTQDTITLALSINHQPMLTPKLKERLAEALNRYFKTNRQLQIKTTAVELTTPVKQLAQEKAEKVHQTKQALLGNEKIKQLIELYDATLEVSP